MKKILSIVLLAALLMTTIVLPVSAESTDVSAQRDDVLVLFDGTMDEDHFQRQWAAGAVIALEEDYDIYAQGEESLFIDMPEDDLDLSFPYGNYALMLILTFDEAFSVEEYPISEFSVYNHHDVEDGYATEAGIQINYVDPENKNGWIDDSFDMDFDVSGWEPGWHLLKHNVVEESNIFGGLESCNPDNISRMRISVKVPLDDENAAMYSEIDWNFDCLIVAKQSFYDDRAAAETDMISIIDGLQTPTVDNYHDVKGSIAAAKAKLDGYLEEFPNFMVESEDKVIKMNEIWAAYQAIPAQEAAATIMQKISELGDITLDNYKDKMTAIQAIDTDIESYTAAGYSQRYITNSDVLDAAKAACTRLGVEESLDTLPAVEAVILEDEDKVKELKATLEALPTEQQALIPQEKKDKIPALLAQIESLKAPAYTLGMVNDDENIDASDALMALQHSVKLIILEDNSFKAADVTGDGTVDASDALLILQYSVKLITAEDFPVAKK